MSRGLRQRIALFAPAQSTKWCRRKFRYVKSRGDVILYVIRLAVRVEGYLSFLLDGSDEVLLAGGSKGGGGLLCGVAGSTSASQTWKSGAIN